MNEKYVRVTDIIDYLYCPRRVYLKRILGIEEKDPKIFFGEILHKSFDILNELEEDIIYEIKDIMEINQIVELYKSRIFPEIENLLNDNLDKIREFNFDINILREEIHSKLTYDILERANRVYKIMIEKELYGIELWDNLIPKIKTEFPVFSRKYNLIGRIDKLEIYRKKVIPIEIKTGNFNKKHLYQINAYILILKDEFKNYEIDKGYLFYRKDNKKLEVTPNKRYFLEIINISEKISEILEGKDPGLNDKSKCLKCKFYNICYGNKNRS